jgi:hypothetical protein
MGIGSIRLATNNPFKVRSISRAGVEITDVVPLTVQPNRFNMDYLKTKALRMSHHIDVDTLVPSAAPTPEPETEADSDATSSGSDIVSESCIQAGEEGLATPPEPAYCFGKHTVLAAIEAISQVRVDATLVVGLGAAGTDLCVCTGQDGHSGGR